MKRNIFRKGIAMIELIFALVILGITLMSAPLLISQATTSSQVTFQQESIAIAATHTSALMTYAWDETNTLPASFLDILNVSGQGDPELVRPAAPILGRSRRPGAVLTNAVIPANIGRDATDHAIDNDDIDDFNNQAFIFELITAANDASQGEYMNTDININTAITYADAALNAINYAANPIIFNNPNTNTTFLGSTNIKLIQTQLTTPNTDANILLNAFTCNIGATVPRTGVGFY